MKIIGIDANVLLSYRLQRASNFPKSKKIIEDCLKGKLQLYIPIPAFLETEWVLRSVYKQSKEQIVIFLEDLLAMEHLLTDHKTTLIRAVLLYKEKGSVNLADSLIAHQIKDKGYDFLTFDKDLEKVFEKIL